MTSFKRALIASTLIIILGLIFLSGGTASQKSTPIHRAAATEPWYAASEIEINPEPVLMGIPAELCVTLQNPTPTPVNVNVMFFWGALGIATADVPINGLRPVYLPPYSIVKECIYWIPPLQQNYSIRVEVYQTGQDTVFAERNIDILEPLQPSTPHSLVFPVRHRESTDATISLGLVPHMDGWSFQVTPDIIYNLPPASTAMCTLTVTPPTELPGGREPIVDVEAWVDGEIIGGFRKIFPAPLRCPGQQFDLTESGTVLTAAGGGQERGVYVTTIKTVDVCAIGMEMDVLVPQSITARIYGANGTLRGSLLAEAQTVAVTTGSTYHFIPLEYSLEPCQDYDITVEFGGVNSWDYILESTSPVPFDVGGAIRVRDGEWNGDASNVALPFISVIGHARGCDNYTVLEPDGQSWYQCSTAMEDRGILVRPSETVTLCDLTWRGNIGVDPVVLSALVYEAPGGVRGPLLAAGDAAVDATGMQSHTVPLSCVLREGVEYDLVLNYPGITIFECLDETTVSLPFLADDAFLVLDGERGGDTSDTVLVHLGATWSPGAGGAPYGMGKSEPHMLSAQPYIDYGAYVEAIIDMRVFSLGWFADVAEGDSIGARVYEASGTSRGVLISEGWIVSSGPGMRWHDVPVTADLTAGADYDFEIDIGDVVEWPYWWDIPGLPYEPYGVIRVVDGEQGGDAGNAVLIHMRFNGCDESATGIADPGPAQTPRFHLALPYPNPVSGVSTVDYIIDQDGPVTIAVYDVAGRLVKTLLRETRRGGPGQTRLDAADMPAGVYFVRMSTDVKSVSRKITVVR